MKVGLPTAVAWNHPRKRIASSSSSAPSVILTPKLTVSQMTDSSFGGAEGGLTGGGGGSDDTSAFNRLYEYGKQLFDMDAQYMRIIKRKLGPR